MTTRNLVGYSLGGRYQILEPLGEGGMATVYKAHDIRLQRDVAIKVIRMEKGADEQFLKRFEREARALAKLSHPNIVHVNDYGDQDGMPYVVMDYLPGGTLRQKMSQPMLYAEAAKLLAPVARALGFAHKMHIVHRDVKPPNILLSQSGDPMLSDFGIAKILEEETSELTGTGVGIGTPEYMAPEQGKGINVDYRADIYALGVVFYELVTGRKPFRADTPMAVILKHMTDPLPRPRSFIPDLPTSVENVIFKALAKKPEDRYQSMEEFALALEGLVQGEKTALAGETLEFGGTRVKKSTAVIGGLSLAAVATIVIVLVICVLAWTFGPWKKSTPTEIAGQGTSPPGLAQATKPAADKGTPGDQSTPSGDFSGLPPGGFQMATSYANGKVVQGQSTECGSFVPPVGAKNLSIMVNWEGGESRLSLVVVDPDGIAVDNSYADAMIIAQSNMMTVNVQSPKQGRWTAQVSGDQVSGEQEFVCIFSADNPGLASGELVRETHTLKGSGGMGCCQFNVPENTPAIVMTITWDDPNSPGYELSVNDPDGVYIIDSTIFKEGSYPSPVDFSSGSKQYSLTIKQPKPGTWNPHIEGTGKDFKGEVDVTLTVSVVEGQ